MTSTTTTTTTTMLAPAVLLAVLLGLTSQVQGQNVVINDTTCGDGAVTTWGMWATWSVPTSCSVSCTGQTGVITRTRVRACPVASMGCSDVAGFDREVYACSGTGGAVNGNVGQWGEWADTGSCSVLCGTGRQLQTRTRPCDNPAPACGGKDCGFVARTSETQYVSCSPGSCGTRCPSYNFAIVRRVSTVPGHYLLCYQSSLRAVRCPSQFDRNAFYVYGYYNARNMYSVCYGSLFG